MEPAVFYYEASAQEPTAFHQNHLHFKEFRWRETTTFFHKLSFLKRYKFEIYIETKAEVDFKYNQIGKVTFAGSKF